MESVIAFVRARWDAWSTAAQRALPDAVVLLLAMFAALWISAAYLHVTGAQSDYLTKHYGVAAMRAMGEGAHNLELPQAQDFLRLREQRLRIERLPEPTADPPPNARYYQQIHRHLFAVVGTAWRVFGVQWNVLFVMQVASFASMVGLQYVLLRIFLPRWIAPAILLPLITSPIAIYVLQNFRDFAKAPFLFALFALYAAIIRFELPRSTYWLLAGITGWVLGLAMGFRQDFLIYAPLSLVLICGFAPGHWRTTWGSRAGAGLVFAIAFGAMAYPAFEDTEFASLSRHFVVLGWTRPHLEELGIAEAPYRLGTHHRDTYAATWTNQYARMHLGADEYVSFNRAPYDDAGTAHLLAYLTYFPADWITRAFVACKRLLDFGPFALPDNVGPDYGRPALLRALQDGRWMWFGWMAGNGTWITMLALAGLSLYGIRHALAAAIVVMFLCGYQTLQIHTRHSFFVEMLPFLALGLLVYGATRGAGIVWRRYRLPDPEPLAFATGLRRLATTAAILAAGTLPVYAVAMLWQYVALGGLYESYVNAALANTEAAWKNYTVQAVGTLPGYLDPTQRTPEDRAFRAQPGMIAVEVAAGAETGDVVVRYDATGPGADYSSAHPIPPDEPGSRYTVFVPLFNTTDNFFGQGERTFADVIVPTPGGSAPPQLRALAKPETLPLWIELTLPERWQSASRFQWPYGAFAPRDVRSRRAFDRSLLANGSFEAWDAGSGVPIDAMDNAEATRIEATRRIVAHGDIAVRQFWTEPDTPAQPNDRFVIDAGELAPGPYELFFDAWNATDQAVAVVDVWVAVRPNTTAMEIGRIAQPAAVYPSTEYTTHRMFFRVPDQGVPAPVWITTAINRAEPKHPIYWDTFRVAPAPSWMRR